MRFGSLEGVLSQRSRRSVLLGLSLGYFMVLFDTTALTVALPDLGRDLGGGVEGLAWAVDSYTLTFAGCLLAAGVAADRHGADRIFRLGLLAFGALSLACATAGSIALSVAGRALLGVAGALLLPASLALTARLNPEPARRATAITAWAAISGSALAAGPLLGGALVAALGWRGICDETGALVGYLHLKDALETKDVHRHRPIARQWIRPLPEIAASDRLRSVLATMQRSGAHLAQATGVDQAPVGVVALEDVLEELVGEIRDGTQRSIARPPLTT